MKHLLISWNQKGVVYTQRRFLGFTNKIEKQAGVELGQAPPELWLEYRDVLLWFEL